MTTEEEINLSECVNEVVCKYKKYLKIFHINAQSLNDSAHKDEFQRIFSDSEVDLIAVSETFFKCGYTFELPNYNVMSVSRNDRGGGGVAVFAHKSLSVKVLQTSDGESFKPEYILVEINLQSDRILFAAIYRPPKVGYMDAFVEDIVNFSTQYKYTIVCGDINARFGSNTCETKVILDCFAECNLEFLPFCDTYHVNNVSSNLDVIASNCNNLTLHYGQVAAPEFSNHDALFAVYNIMRPRIVKKFIVCRNYQNFSPESFYNDAELVPWYEIILLCDINNKVEYLNKLFIDLVDKHAPWHTVHVKRFRVPWFNKKILQMIGWRKKARSKFARTRTDADWQAFKKIRNEVKSEIKKAKVSYYNNLFSVNTSKQMWNAVKSLGLGKQKSVNDEIAVDVNDLNNHYLSVGATDSNNRLEKVISHYESMLPTVGDSFHFSHVYPEDIRKVVMSITSKAIGCDGISLSLLKICLEPLLPVLEHIFNYSMQTCVFPDVWKAANIKPIPKIKTPTQCKDYRPVSILNVLSKVFEKVVYSQTVQHLDKYSILNQMQSGFRRHHSTITALINVTDDIKKAMDEKQTTLLVLLDFSKAFDCVHHRLLLSKLKSIGFSKSVLMFFESYLSNRYQRVIVSENNMSDWGLIKSGVPQGSVLGPLLFAMYINDLPEVIRNLCRIHKYADDIELYIHFYDRDIDMAIETMNTCIDLVTNYTADHNLQINASKTQPIIIGARRIVNRLKTVDLPMVVVNDLQIPYCDSVCNLGVFLDQTLSWSVHVQNVIKKALSTLIQIRRNSTVLPALIRKRIVQSLVFPQLDYGSLIMSGMSQYLSVKMQRMQNACIRFVYDLRRDVHVTPYYKLSNLLKYADKRNLYMAIAVFKIMRSEKPPYLFNRFQHLSQVSQRCNRLHSKRLHVPKYRTETYNHSFTVTAAKLWNSYELYNHCDLSVFVLKKRLTDLLIQKYL
jgi:hypothetical protein